MTTSEVRLLALLNASTAVRPQFSWWGVVMAISIVKGNKAAHRAQYVAVSRNRGKAHDYAEQVADYLLSTGLRLVDGQPGAEYAAFRSDDTTAIVAVDYNPGASNSARAYGLRAN